MFLLLLWLGLCSRQADDLTKDQAKLWKPQGHFAIVNVFSMYTIFYIDMDKNSPWSNESLFLLNYWANLSQLSYNKLQIKFDIIQVSINFVLNLIFSATNTSQT